MKKFLSAILSLSLVLSLFVCYTAVSAETTANSDDLYRIEAESGTTSGTAWAAARADASGGKYVAGIGGGSTDERNAYVELTATMAMAGTYKMTICYKSASAIPGNNLSVNGGDPVTLSYTTSESFTTYDVYVVLEEGVNTIKLSGVPGSDAWAQIDYIEIDLSSTTVKVEAETGVLDGALLSSNGNPSGGKSVGSLGGNSNEDWHSVTMTVTAPKAGRYKMSLAVNSSDSTTASGHNLSINGADPVTLSYTPSSAYTLHDVIVELKEGENSVKVSGIPGSSAWARLDYIEIDFAKQVNRYEAEDGVLGGDQDGHGANRFEKADASGGWYVGGLGGGSQEQDNSVTMTVTVPKSGTYTISIRTRSSVQYATASGSGHNLTVNGGDPVTLSYPVSDTYFYYDVIVELNGGDNTVKISGIPNNGAWGYIDCIDVYVPTRYYITDFSALSDALEAYSAIRENNEYCGEEEAIAFCTAYDIASEVLVDTDALQYEVDAATEALVSAANALVSNGKHVVSENYSNDRFNHWHNCENGCEIMFDYDEHDWDNGVCSTCDYVCEHSVTADDADCAAAAVCSYCGVTVAEKDTDNHAKGEQWHNNGNGTHTVYYGCCDTYGETVGCEYGSDNVCEKCGYDRIPAINNAQTNANNAFENIFKGGENEVVAVGPQGEMSDDYKVAKPAPVTGFTYAQFNLLFDENGKVFLRHHFIIEGDVTVTLNGEAVDLKNDGCPENVYYIDVAPEAGKYHIADTITVNGTTDIKVSLYSYIKVALESGALSPEQETLLRALYDLNEAAK